MGLGPWGAAVLDPEKPILSPQRVMIIAYDYQSVTHEIS